MKQLIAIGVFLLAFNVNAQTITTFGGGGSGGLGDGGPATSAVISDPIGGTFDKFGNYYCAEAVGGNVIRKISNAGIISTVVGNGSSGFAGDNGAATAATLSDPTAVKLDTEGNIYIADANNMRIRKVNAITGIITTIAGSSLTGSFGGDNGQATVANLFAPTDICFDKLGNLYVADEQNYRIRKINSLGIITTIAGTGLPGYTGDDGPATAAKISLSNGLAIDNTGNLYIAGGNVVRKIDPTGIITTVAGTSGYYLYTRDGIPATNAPISPIKLAIDEYLQLIIADDLNRRVYRVDHEGIIHVIAGNGMTGFNGDGGSATLASLDYPSGITFDSCGNLYVCEANNKRIRKVAFNPFCVPVEVSKLYSNEVIVYPNPTYEVLNINNVKTNTKYVVVNITGIIEQHGTLKKGSNTISIKSLPPGMYMLQLTDNTGQRTVRKIIKE